MKEIVYHGSASDTTEIKSHKSTHMKECIYATPNKAVALTFMGNKSRGDLDTVLGTFDGELSLVERRPNILNDIYNTDGYLYYLDGTTFSHYDYLWSKEVISFEKSLKPIKKEYYKNILETLTEEEKKGNIKIYRYPDRPKSVPLDNSDLIEKYINFESQGLTGAINDLLEVYPEFTELVEEKLKNKTSL